MSTDPDQLSFFPEPASGPRACGSGALAVVPRRSAGSTRWQSIAWWACTVAVLAGWFVALRPRALGGPAAYVMVRGVSMEPTYHTGDLVVTRARRTYRAGDIVAYRVPAGDVGAGAIVIHRIVGGDGIRGYVLRGDNNSSDDDWHPTDRDVAGEAWVLIPVAGKALAKLQDPRLLASLAAALTVMMVMLWDPRKKQKRRASRTA